MSGIFLARKITGESDKVQEKETGETEGSIQLGAR
jgi:hypothetical protein